MALSLTLDSRDEATIVKEDGPDGFSAETIFKAATGCQGLTYDDVILMPGKRSPYRNLMFMRFSSSMFLAVRVGRALSAPEDYRYCVWCCRNGNSSPFPELMRMLCRCFRRCASCSTPRETARVER